MKNLKTVEMALKSVTYKGMLQHLHNMSKYKYQRFKAIILLTINFIITAKNKSYLVNLKMVLMMLMVTMVHLDLMPQKFFLAMLQKEVGEMLKVKMDCLTFPSLED